MAEEEEKQHRHATLAGEHERKAQWHKGLSGGKSNMPDTSEGSQAGGFIGAIMEHKWAVVGGIAAIIVFIMAMKGFKNQGSSNTANQGPDASQGGYVPSNIGTALDSINAALSGIASQLSPNQQPGTPVLPPSPSNPPLPPIPPLMPPPVNPPITPGLFGNPPIGAVPIGGYGPPANPIGPWGPAGAGGPPGSYIVRGLRNSISSLPGIAGFHDVGPIGGGIPSIKPGTIGGSGVGPTSSGRFIMGQPIYPTVVGSNIIPSGGLSSPSSGGFSAPGAQMFGRSSRVETIMPNVRRGR